MDECYLCGRPVVSECSICQKSVCRVHAEEVGRSSVELLAICSVCLHKRKLKRIRMAAIVFVVILALVFAILIITNSLQSID